MERILVVVDCVGDPVSQSEERILRLRLKLGPEDIRFSPYQEKSGFIVSPRMAFDYSGSGECWCADSDSSERTLEILEALEKHPQVRAAYVERMFAQPTHST